MIREVLTHGVVKESRDSAVRNSPRHHGLMAGRHPHRSPINWTYVFCGMFFIFLTVTLVLSNSTAQQPIAPLNSQTTDPASSVHVAHLSLKVTELQNKVRDFAAQESTATSLAELKLERAFTHNLLVQISTGLDEIAKLLGQTSGKKTNLVASNPSVTKDVESDTGKSQQFATAGTRLNLSPPEPLHDFFDREEIREYIKVRENRGGLKNFMGVKATYGAIGHACVSNKPLLEKYMDYDIGEVCRDDWVIAQQLILRGCEPLPRRRCRARGPKQYTKPLPANESLWGVPADENIGWENYYCRNFSCLADWQHRNKFFKCSPCFDLRLLEKQRWVVPNTTAGEFLIADVLAIKPREIRIGLDYSMGTGTFAARMKEHDVTIVSTTLNLGAPFSEVIALRGLLPLYISINQRLPFFDNTLDIVHTTLLLDAWIAHQPLDFILFDFDRILRPGGLLWLDRFFCHREELAEYLFYFKRLRYKTHMWLTIPKTDRARNEVYFSAVWEKPHTPL